MCPPTYLHVHRAVSTFMSLTYQQRWQKLILVFLIAMKCPHSHVICYNHKLHHHHHYKTIITSETHIKNSTKISFICHTTFTPSCPQQPPPPFSISFLTSFSSPSYCHSSPHLSLFLSQNYSNSSCNGCPKHVVTGEQQCKDQPNHMPVLANMWPLKICSTLVTWIVSIIQFNKHSIIDLQNMMCQL